MKEEINTEDLTRLGLTDVDYTKKSDAELFGYKNIEWEGYLDFQRWKNDEEYDNFCESVRD
jgi:hypothetical protein